MIQIRRGVFETNSSSTHSLSMTSENIDYSEFNESAFNKKYVITPFKSDEVYDFMEIYSIEDKLRYFLTLYYQSSSWHREEFMKLLKKIFPNVIFSLEIGYLYVFEDGEYFFDDYFNNPECKKLMDEDVIKKFMLCGTINFGDRNNEEYSDKIDSIRFDKNLWNIDWSG